MAPREIEASVQMKLYTLTKRQLALVVLAFIVIFSTCLIIGLAGPQVIHTTSQKIAVVRDSFDEVVFSLSTSLPLTVFNQQLWLIATPLLQPNTSSKTVEEDVEVTVHVFYTDKDIYEKNLFSDISPSARNKQLHQQPTHTRHILCTNAVCNSLALLHLSYIDKQSYQITVKVSGLKDQLSSINAFNFEIKTYKSSFTQLELWFRTVFLTFTFFIAKKHASLGTFRALTLAHHMLYFFASVLCWNIALVLQQGPSVHNLSCYTHVKIWFNRTLRPYIWQDWSIEQKWMVVLLPLLLLYNNPLFALALLISSSAPPVIDGIFQATFLCALLLFWLCIYHSIRQTKRVFLRFYLPKLLIVSLIWLSAVTLSTWQAVNERSDPTYNYRADTVNFMGFKVFFFIIAGLYTLLLLYYLIRAFIELRNVAYFDVRLKFTSLFMVAVFVISLAILVLRFGTGVLDQNFISAISMRYGSSAEFLAFYALLNLYVYTMAFVYSPSRNALTESRLHDNPVISMLNDSDEDTMYGSDRENAYKPVNNFVNRLAEDSD